MLTPDQSRQFDQVAIKRLGIPGIVLMENAGRGCAEAMIWHSPQWALNDQSAVIVCGPGNNGGDGFVIARHLWNSGWSVKVVLTVPVERYRGDAAIMLTPVLNLPMPVVQLEDRMTDSSIEKVVGRIKRTRPTWIVDAMLGTGSQGPLRGIIAATTRVLNQIDARRMAVDLPTGLNGLTGDLQPETFRADLTCTFIDQKVGFQNEVAEPFLGFVKVIPIGIDRRAIRV
ncbi:MAG: NAD(P)H-hydrate epimerase [Planctomycetota bacterium]